MCTQYCSSRLIGSVTRKQYGCLWQTVIMRFIVLARQPVEVTNEFAQL